jgi:hypothetical protein
MHIKLAGKWDIIAASPVIAGGVCPIEYPVADYKSRRKLPFDGTSISMRRLDDFVTQEREFDRSGSAP